MFTLSYGGLMLAGFLSAASLVLLVFLVVSNRDNRVGKRLGSLASEPFSDAVSGRPFSPDRHGNGPSAATTNRIDRWTRREMRREQAKEGLKQRMAQAGFYKPRAIAIFVTLRIILMAAPAVGGVLAARAGLISLTQGLVFGGLAGLAGTLAPVLWLGHVKRSRQLRIRRALPDALDVMVICLEGGLSLPAAFSRVARELATAHRMLAVEFNIVERQIQMGRTTGEAVRALADRFDLEELRSMASVITQAERVGASLVTALQVFADTLRQKRHQRAEEMAHKASVKLLFPTIFFIFPGIFVVVLGPAAIRIYQELLNGALLINETL